MKLEELFQKICKFFITYCEIEFEFAGVHLTVGGLLLFAVITGIFIMFLKGLAS